MNRSETCATCIHADIYVWQECPACGDVRLCAIVTPGAWWAPADPLSCLKSAFYCACGQAPPMLDAQRRNEQGALFAV